MNDARGGILLGWFFKIAVLLAILAVVSFETGAIIVAKVTADRVAIDAASEAGAVYADTRDLQKAEDAANKIAAKDDAKVIKFGLIPGGQYIQLTVRKIATTFLIQHIGLKRFRIADSVHSGVVH